MLLFCLYQGRFLPDHCSTGIVLSSDCTLATKTDERGANSVAMLSRPTPDDQGGIVITWHLAVGGATFGWVVPDFHPSSESSLVPNGACVSTSGELVGVGAKAIAKLPSGGVPVGSTLSLRFHPTRGTMHARVNGGAAVLCFSDLRSDLVPAVRLHDKGDACTVLSDAANQKLVRDELEHECATVWDVGDCTAQSDLDCDDWS